MPPPTIPEGRESTGVISPNLCIFSRKGVGLGGKRRMENSAEKVEPKEPTSTFAWQTRRCLANICKRETCLFSTTQQSSIRPNPFTSQPCALKERESDLVKKRRTPHSQTRVHQGGEVQSGRVDASPVVIRVRLRDQDHGLFSISDQRKASRVPCLSTCT